MLGYGVVLMLGVFYPERPGFAVPDLGRGHTPGCAPSYNSQPPTSGCHSSSQAAYGIHDSPIPHELQVHNLEHGAVILQYRTSGLITRDEALRADLENLVRHLRNSDPRYCRLIAAPYPYRFAAPDLDAGMPEDAVLALTAWGRMALLEGYDEGRIKMFIDAWINKGPEDVPDCQI